MKRALVLIPLVAVLMGMVAQPAQAAPNRPDSWRLTPTAPAWMFGYCNLLPTKPSGVNSSITAPAHTSCSESVYRLYLRICIFKGPDTNFSNAHDIGCSSVVYHDPDGEGYTWTCANCDYIGPHHFTEFNQGKGYYFTWAEGWCSACTPKWRAGPSKASWWNGITCS